MIAPTEANFYSAFLHELNQPLTTLRNVLELTTYRENNDWPSVVDTALSNIDRMVELLDLMSELSRFERAAAPKEDVDLTALLREALDDLSASAQASGRTLQERTVAAGVRVTAVSETMRSALYRLLADAIYHLREGESVSVALESTGGNVVLEVVYPGAPFAENEMNSMLALARSGCGPRGGITRRVFRLSLSLRLFVLQGAELQFEEEKGGSSRLRITYRQAI